jgi:hypothetical protein
LKVKSNKVKSNKVKSRGKPVCLPNKKRRHCEDRRSEAIQRNRNKTLDCFSPAGFAMTKKEVETLRATSLNDEKKKLNDE